MSCGVGCRRGSDPALLWLWHRLEATGLIRPLAWEPPYAAGAAQRNSKKSKKKKYYYNQAICGSAEDKAEVWVHKILDELFIFLFYFFVFCLFFRAAPTAYEGSQARGRIGAVATSLHQSHSNVGSELHLQPTPQFMATPDP